jgi:hypothetical protein
MLIKRIAVLWAFFFISWNVMAQPCFPNGITLANQEDIDQFSANFPNCTEIEGFLRIEEAVEGNITDLHGLININHIGGNLEIISNQNLEDLVGLNFIQDIDGSVWITQNPSLKNLNGLYNLTNVGGFFSISFNDAMFNLNGMENLKSVGDYFTIQFNANLNNVSSLDSLTTVGNFFTIQQNPALKFISFFESLSYVDGFFSIQFNENLEKIEGFSQLNKVNNFLVIQNNPTLMTFNAFNSLDSIALFLSIQGNTSIQTMYGFDALKSIGGNLNLINNTELIYLEAFNHLDSIHGNLFLNNNTRLSTLQAFQMLEHIGGNYTISNCDALDSPSKYDMPLNSINGDLSFTDNDSLSNILTIRNIEANSMESLVITGNPNLSECDVKCICDYIGTTEATVTIENNKTGCNSEEEVDEKCGLHPSCTFLTEPIDGQKNVLVTTQINWMAIPEASGYYLSIGLGNEEYDLLEGYDVGTDTLYNNPFNYPCQSEIFVKIEPYNQEGVAFACVEESFSTEVEADAGTNVSICTGSSIQLQASGGSTVTWNPMAGLNNPFIPNPLASPNQTTTYYATIGNGNGCTAIDSVKITVLEAPSPNAISTDETGFEFKDGTASCFPDGGSPPYKINWSTGDTTTMIDSLSPGSYFLSVTDENLCRGRDTVNIDAYECPQLTPFFNIEPISCNGQCDALIYISNILNATPPFQYEWDNGDTTNLIEDLCPGNYAITLTDAKNCSIQLPFSINEPDELQLEISSTSETGNDFEDGSAQAIPTGGTPPYSFEWSNGMETQEIVDLAPGSYTLTVTDLNDCRTEGFVIIEEYICPELDLVAETENASCFGWCDGRIIPQLINGTWPYQFEWSNGSQADYLLDLCAGNYAVTITDGRNCSVNDAFVIDEPEEIQLYLEEVVPYRVGLPGSIDMTLINEENYVIQWSGPDDFSAETLDIDSLDIGCYNIIVTHIETECTFDTTICVDDFTSTNNIKQDIEVELFPNPSNGQLTIRMLSDLTSPILLTFWNARGEKIHEESYDRREISLDFTKRTSGLYFVLVQQGENRCIKKWVILP